MARRPLDAYQTPAWMVRELTRHVTLTGTIFEPCVGDGSIPKALAPLGLTIVTNDLSPTVPADLHLDVTQAACWAALEAAGGADWILTNPPYQKPVPLQILRHGLPLVRKGVILMLRISFLEPTHDRGPWLAFNPPAKYLVMPRHSFTGNGSSDSATTAWCVWSHDPLPGRPIECCYHARTLHELGE